MNPKELREENQKAYDKWFERWYSNQKIESKLKQAAMEGYTAYAIVAYESLGEYTKRRMEDKRFVKKLESKLSEFNVYKEEPRKYEKTMFGRHLGYGWTDTKITISWLEKEMTS